MKSYFKRISKIAKFSKYLKKPPKYYVNSKLSKSDDEHFENKVINYLEISKGFFEYNYQVKMKEIKGIIYQKLIENPRILIWGLSTESHLLKDDYHFQSILQRWCQELNIEKQDLDQELNELHHKCNIFLVIFLVILRNVEGKWDEIVIDDQYTLNEKILLLSIIQMFNINYKL